VYIYIYIINDDKITLFTIEKRILHFTNGEWGGKKCVEVCVWT